MADLERQYVIPLRKSWLGVESYRRTPRAIYEIKKFLSKHMKVKDVRILKELNEELHKHGRKNPPHKVSVKVKKVSEKEGDYVLVNLISASVEVKKKKDDKKKPKKEEAHDHKHETPEEHEKHEKKEVLEHAEHDHPKEHHSKADKMPVKTSPSPKAEKIVGQTGKK